MTKKIRSRLIQQVAKTRNTNPKLGALFVHFFCRPRLSPSLQPELMLQIFQFVVKSATLMNIKNTQQASSEGHSPINVSRIAKNSYFQLCLFCWFQLRLFSNLLNMEKKLLTLKKKLEDKKKMKLITLTLKFLDQACSEHSGFTYSAQVQWASVVILAATDYCCTD